MNEPNITVLYYMRVIIFITYFCKYNSKNASNVHFYMSLNASEATENISMPHLGQEIALQRQEDICSINLNVETHMPE